MRVHIPGWLVLLLAFSFLAPLAVSAQTPEATPDTPPEPTGGAWQVADVRELDIGVWYAALSPDGQFLAGTGPDATFCVWDVDTLESECAGEPISVRPETVTWSPDSTAVAFAPETIPSGNDSDIYVFERETGELVNLTDDGVEGPLDEITDIDPPIDNVPTWSPDSRQIAFARTFRGDGESATTALMRIDRVGGEPVEIALLDMTEPLAVWLPMYWQPDGTLVYTQNTTDIEDPNNGVWTVRIQGSDSPTLIVPGGEESDFGGPMMVSDIAGDKAIVFAYWLVGDVGFDGGRHIFWLADLETGEYEPLPAPPDVGGEPPWLVDASFSPDGSTILLVTKPEEGTLLMALDVATGAITPIEPEPRDERYIAAAPQWVSNNTLLLQRADNPLLFTLDQTGESTVASPVASPAAPSVATDTGWGIADERELNIDTRFAALSPDGQHVAGLGPDEAICIWDVETLEPQCAGEDLPIRAETIAWAPDGTAVAFALDAIRLAYESDIYVYELASGELVNLTDDGIEGGLLDNIDQDPPADDVPVWSPDSQQIAFARSYRGDEEPGSTSIMRIDRTGGEPVEVAHLTDQPFNVWMPMHWLPDGTLVYSQIALELDNPANGVWMLNIAGGTPTMIAPGDEDSDIPGPMISDIAGGKAIVYSYYLMAQFGAEVDQPIFWIVDLATGEREPMSTPPAANGTVPWELEVSFSPDGATILMVTSTSDGSQLMTLDLATSVFAPLQSEPSDVRYLPGTPQWAPNNTVLLQRPQGPLLFTLTVTGEAAPSTPVATPVAEAAGWRIAEERELEIGVRYAALSPDGQWLAGIGPDSTLCIWDVTSLVSRCLEDRLPIQPESITWAPDSSAVAFSLDAYLRYYESDIYVLERQLWTLSNITDDGVEGDAFDGAEAGVPLDTAPAWSPDSQRIAFVRSTMSDPRSETSEGNESAAIMWIDRSGGQPVEMLPLGVDDPFAVWAPMHWLDDGNLLYSQLGQDRSDPRTGLWRVGVDDGSSPMQLMPGSDGSEFPWPVVAGVEDGKAIVYTYVKLMQIGFDEGEPLYWMLDLETGEYTPILPPGDDNSAVVVSAGFSPDGDKVLLVTRSSEGSRLMVLDVASGEVTPLDDAPRDTVFAAHAAQWTGNDTVLVLTAGDPLLITLERIA